MDVLIYEDNDADAEKLVYRCQQEDLHTVLAKERDDALKLIAQSHFDFCIVDCAMPTLKLDPALPVIVLVDVTSEDVFHVFRYNPKAVIVRPISSADISVALFKVMGKIASLNRYPARLVDIYQMLQTMEYFFAKMRREKYANISISESFLLYCQEECPIAVTSNEYDPQKHRNFDLIHPFTDRGNVYCDRKERCEGFRFLDWLGKQGIQMSIPIEKIFAASSGHNSFYEHLTKTRDAVWLQIDEAYSCKRKFCEKMCTQKKEGAGYQKGDHLLEVKNNVICYCTEQSCPLENYFDLFAKRILN